MQEKVVNVYCISQILSVPLRLFNWYGSMSHHMKLLVFFIIQVHFNNAFLHITRILCCSNTYMNTFCPNEAIFLLAQDTVNVPFEQHNFHC